MHKHKHSYFPAVDVIYLFLLSVHFALFIDISSTWEKLASWTKETLFIHDLSFVVNKLEAWANAAVNEDCLSILTPIYLVVALRKS